MNRWRFLTGSDAPPRHWGPAEYIVIGMRILSLVIIVFLAAITVFR